MASSIPRSRFPSGRPGPGEYASYAREDVDAAQGDDAVGVLARQRDEVLGFFAALDERAVEGLRYAPGKWTVKEVLGHMIDDERIFLYRALCLARGEPRELPGFDEKLYAEGADFETRPLADLLVEYRLVRDASLAFFAGLPAAAWLRHGVVNGYPATVRGLAFHVAGHELHHLRILHERYLPLPRTSQ